MAATFITPQLFRFLRALKRNNDRDWFANNKQRYHEEVRDPLCAFIEVLGPKLRAISPSIIADSRPVGGSLFRIYRDTRFSKDKSPYKTYAGMHFLTAPKGVASPTLYLHLEPGRVFAAGGMWHPDADMVRAIRNEICESGAGWKRVKKVGLDDSERLKRPPRGFDPDHPLIEDLKLKSFTSSVNFSEDEVCAIDFMARFVRACRARKPLLVFVAGALGVKI